MVNISLVSIVKVLLLLAVNLVVSSGALQCGVPKVKINEVIVRGHDAKPGSFPWHAAVYHRKGRSDTYACGGTLVSSFYVLTADHCVKDDNDYVLSPKRVFTRLGVYNLNVPNLQTSQQHNIFKIHQYSGTQQRRNDIALLELSTEVKFNDHVQPACINREEHISGQYGVAVGWGITEDDEVSSTLKAVQMPVVSTAACLEHDRDTFGQSLDSSSFCAGYTNGTTVCNGDSGGGLHVKRADTWYIVGIISFTAVRGTNSYLCRTDSYAAFTNVAVFASWIRNVTGLDSPVVNDSSSIRGGDQQVSMQNLNDLPKNCGTYLVSRIVGGDPASLFEFPWMAHLMYKSDEYQCGGSLISKRYVLTAAQCVYNFKPLQVRLGEYDLSHDKDCSRNDDSDCAPPVQDVDIETIIPHQKYNNDNKQNDIALLRLARDVTFEDHIQPICLPVAQNLRMMKLQQYIVTGFGITDVNDPKTSTLLMKATVPAAAVAECQKSFRNIVFGNSLLCAGGDGRDTCVGDAGGPLGYPVHDDGVRFVQFGVTSFGKRCGQFPAVYTNVAYFVDWILALGNEEWA